MPFYGDLRTVSLTDLLRWASAADKTGVLEVERNAIRRRIEFRKGFVGSCSSNDPSALLGQFLLSRRRINEIQLQHLLTLQKISGRALGPLLVDLRLLRRSDLTCEVAAKAEETILSVFDWDDAWFRFDEGATLDPDQIEVNLSVDELIEKGLARAEQVTRIRASFCSSGVVLGRTAVAVPADAAQRPLTQRILESIDGHRTLAEILLHTRTSEFRVLQFLHRLHERGVFEVREVRPVAPDSATLLDPFRKETSSEGPAPADDDRASTSAGNATVSMTPGVDGEIVTAIRMLERREYEPAVELLRASCREHPTDYARRLLAQAEQAFVEAIHAIEEPASRIPVLQQDRHALHAEELSPEDSFLLSMIDGKTDVQSVLWLAPMREVDTLIALRRMARKGMIELADPRAVAALAANARLDAPVDLVLD